jgi:alcohol dehydrogenase YqhD (iron-dependent ADH family)
MRDITEAVDMVRKQEHRALLRETGASILTGTKYLWLYAGDHLPPARRTAFTALRRTI